MLVVNAMFDIQAITAILLRWFWMHRRGWIKRLVVWPSPVW